MCCSYCRALLTAALVTVIDYKRLSGMNQLLKWAFLMHVCGLCGSHHVCENSDGVSVLPSVPTGHVHMLCVTSVRVDKRMYKRIPTRSRQFSEQVK